ncbi:MAG: outer membrane beta-barrel family protein, partial [Desulfovibrionales bacterium]|nr:outer membrane beta-barrel family protein [Desulfovibrionales bacterium]
LKSLNLVGSSSYAWSNASQVNSESLSVDINELEHHVGVKEFANSAELGFSSFGLDLIINIGLGVESLVLQKTGITETMQQNNQVNLYPLIFGKYFITSKSNLVFFIRGSSFSPNAKQLLPSVNLYDPLQVSVGNPYLEPGSQYLLAMKYVNAISSKAQYVSAYLFGKYTTNFIGLNSQFLSADTVIYGQSLQAGTSINSSVNLDNAYNLIGGADYSFPVGFVSSNCNVGVRYYYSNFPSIFNDKEFRGASHSGGVNASLSSNISTHLDFLIKNEIRYSQSSNSENDNHSKYVLNDLEGSLYYKFLKRFSIQISTVYLHYNYFEDASKQDIIVSNVGVGTSVFDNKLHLKLTVHDIFDQNNAQTFELRETYSQITQSNSIGRYVMISGNFKF